ncbi:hypothetical protein [Actinomadura coerulea]|uniref:hypothetical protein n=1 Tax=Actinomadura coerulea TaxID=46159 RepID=UPI0034383417
MVAHDRRDTEDARRGGGERVIAERVTVRPVGRDCGWCGAWVPYSGRGRPRAYCSKSCRNRASELRTIEARLGRQLAVGALRSRPVREVVERTTERVIERRAVPRAEVSAAAAELSEMAVLAGDAIVIPATARQWSEVLELLTEALQQPGPLRAKHFDHRHIYTGLARALGALDDAHPGGIDAL